MKKIFFLILLVNVYINTFAQSGSENMLKYWHYRNRLKYFVIPGTKQGESEIISQRNDFTENDSIHPDPLHKWSTISQHGVYFGYYLSMLATEYKLLSDNGQTNEATNTLHEINLALLQFENYMDRCENYWGYPDVEDGFFVSENMPNNPCDFMDTTTNNGHTTNGERHLDLLNKNLTLGNNVWNSTTNTFGLPAGHPGYTDFIDARICTDGETTKKAMTKDEVIGVLQGLALVRRFCPISSWEYSESKILACKIITFVRNEYEDNGVIPIRWLIFQPDGFPVHNPNNSWIWWQFGPGDARNYAYAFIQAAHYFDNTCNNNYADPEAGLDEANWEPIGLHHNPVVWNNSMSATLAAIGKSWHVGITINLGCCWNWCPNWLPCVHIPAYIPATGWGIKNVTSYYNSETFYLMIYQALHNKSTTYMNQSKALTQINSAPCEGPYNYGNGNRPTDDIWGGWSGSYRWRDLITEQQGCCDPNGNYNGLDFMIFYNLYHIIYGGIPYENYNDRYLSDTVSTPQNLVAFNSITSTQVIDSQTPPIVNYKAGEQIELKPGFHAQEGSTFHAYIDKVGCGENFITDSTYIPPVDTLTSEDTCITVDLPAMPCGYDTVHFNGIDGDTANQYSYVWTFIGGANIPFSTIKNPDVYYANPGTYEISLEITDTATGLQSGRLCFYIVKPACYDSSSISVEKRLNNNTPNPDLKTLKNDYQFTVFPNPTTGIFNVNCSDKSIVFSIEISDLLKNTLYLKENFSGNTQFDLSSNPKGIYFVKVITSDGNIFVSKVVNQ